jgi:hypothetical protein
MGKGFRKYGGSHKLVYGIPAQHKFRILPIVMCSYDCENSYRKFRIYTKL